MAAEAWTEIDTAISENRRELVLSGKDVQKRIAGRNGSLDERLFTLRGLNFLEISKAGLTMLHADIAQLDCLTNLGLDGNKLTELPSAIGKLIKLKFLDVSSNELVSLPEELGQLKELQTLNVSKNKLTEIVDISKMVQLHVLDAAHNELTELPDSITDEKLALLSSIIVHHNKISSLPDDLFSLATLKLLDVSDNVLEVIPSSMCECAKLKDFRYGGNKLKDKRLAKMSGQCSTKAVLDYLQGIRAKEEKPAGKQKGEKVVISAAERKRQRKVKQEQEVESKLQDVINVLHYKDDNGVMITVTPAATAARPYIVCCILRNLNFFKSQNMMRRFLAIQTKLHDTLCAKRQSATIATHDLEAIKSPLVYDARDPAEMKLLPLGKSKETTGKALVQKLRQEAEQQRKESKRSTVSGIHKYLDLLKDQKLYPCLVDNTGQIISFPPITNCDHSKVQNTTRHVLVEVTSSVSLDICKSVMHELVSQILALNIGQSTEPPRVVFNLQPIKAQLADVEGGASNRASQSESSSDVSSRKDSKSESAANHEAAESASADADTGAAGGGGGCMLIVEQVRVLGEGGGLRVVYPSRVDLESSEYRVVRESEED